MSVILAIDPSGNFEEGKGKTGIAISYNGWECVKTYTVDAAKYSNRMSYWDAVIEYVHKLLKIREEGYDIHVVIEKYVMRNNGFTIGKMPETVMLIGLLIYFCEKNGIKYTLQTPSQVKKRYSNEHLTKLFPQITYKNNRYQLEKSKILNDHERDALKHLAFYKNYMED
jgi:hypothetical protein